MANDKEPSNWKSFNDRYATDAEFKKSVDTRRSNAETQRNHNALKDSLDMIRGVRGAKPKRY